MELSKIELSSWEAVYKMFLAKLIRIIVIGLVLWSNTICFLLTKSSFITSSLHVYTRMPFRLSHSKHCLFEPLNPKR